MYEAIVEKHSDFYLKTPYYITVTTSAKKDLFNDITFIVMNRFTRFFHYSNLPRKENKKDTYRYVLSLTVAMIFKCNHQNIFCIWLMIGLILKGFFF